MIISNEHSDALSRGIEHRLSLRSLV